MTFWLWYLPALAAFYAVAQLWHRRQIRRGDIRHRERMAAIDEKYDRDMADIRRRRLQFEQDIVDAEEMERPWN